MTVSPILAVDGEIDTVKPSHTFKIIVPKPSVFVVQAARAWFGLTKTRPKKTVRLRLMERVITFKKFSFRR